MQTCSGAYNIEKCTAPSLIIIFVLQIVFLGNIIMTCGLIMYEEIRGPLQVEMFQTSFSWKVPCAAKVVEPPHPPPTRLLVAVPTQSGEYPVVIFQHGFFMANCFYTQLIEHVASYGYILVAPQVITVDTDATQEIEDLAEMIGNWLPGNLPALITSAVTATAAVTPDLDKLVLAGHSRGGKVAFALALGLVANTTLNFSGLVALDPVDGVWEPSNPPIVMENCDHCLHLPFPTLILGTGYGTHKPLIGPACAPACCGHQAFYTCSSAPKLYHFVASEFGHLDFLDDSISWTSLICKSGVSKVPLRNFTGCLFVAFLQSALNGTSSEPIDDIATYCQNAASIKVEELENYSTQRPPRSASVNVQLISESYSPHDEFK